MSAFESLLELIATSTPGSEPVSSSAELDAVRALAARSPSVTRLLSLVIDERRKFAFGVLEIYPSVFTRLARHPGVLGPTELVVGNDGGGDLYLADVASGGVRRVIHDEGWVSRGQHASLDAWIERAMWVSLESIEADEVDELAERGADFLRTLRWAHAQQPEALQDETREALEAAGLIDAITTDDE
ncbi:MAG: hypothetical protein U0353_04165 [Sandaracinus sp.]